MTRSDIIQKVAKDQGLLVKIVQECHDQYWFNIVKVDVNRPDFDNYELPMLGVLQIKQYHVRSLMKKFINTLRATRLKLELRPESEKLLNQEKYYIKEIKWLWRLKNDIF